MIPTRELMSSVNCSENLVFLGESSLPQLFRYSAIPDTYNAESLHVVYISRRHQYAESVNCICNKIIRNDIYA